MALAPVPERLSGISSVFFQSEIIKQLTKQYEYYTPVLKFSGPAGSAAVVHNYKSVDHFTCTVPRLSSVDIFSAAKDYAQVRGNEQILKVDGDLVNLELFSLSTKFPYRQTVASGSPEITPGVLAAQQSSLVSGLRRRLSHDIFRAATNWAYPNLVNYTVGSVAYDTRAHMNAADTGPSYHRHIICGKKQTSAQYYAGAQFQTFFNGLNVANNGLTSDAINQAQLLARRGGKGLNPKLNEHKIQPYTVTTHDGFQCDQYVLFVDPRVSLALKKSAADATINRGTVLQHQANIIDGHRFVGEFHGVLVYEVDELADMSFVSADGNAQIAWSLLCGAGALGYARHGDVMFFDEYDKPERLATFYAQEQRGQKLLKYPTALTGLPTTRVEQGAIHLFSVIDA